MMESCADICMIEDLVGTPYVRNGRLPGPGTDCFGLIVEAFRRRGVTVPDPFTSSTEACDVRRWIVERLSGWRRYNEPRPGRVVEFRGIGTPAHVGYLISAAEMVHSTPKSGAIISRIDREPWGSRILGFYDYCGA